MREAAVSGAGERQNVGYETLAAVFSHIPPAALEELCAEARKLHAQATKQGSEVGGRPPEQSKPLTDLILIDSIT